MFFVSFVKKLFINEKLVQFIEEILVFNYFEKNKSLFFLLLKNHFKVKIFQEFSIFSKKN